MQPRLPVWCRRCQWKRSYLLDDDATFGDLAGLVKEDHGRESPTCVLGSADIVAEMTPRIFATVDMGRIS